MTPSCDKAKLDGETTNSTRQVPSRVSVKIRILVERSSAQGEPSILMTLPGRGHMTGDW
jgi:hypothetical protein